MVVFTLISQKAVIGLPCIGLHFRECGMVGSAYVQYRAFSHEPPLEDFSRGRRVIPLKIASVLALLKLRQFWRMRVVPRKECLSSRFVG